MTTPCLLVEDEPLAQDRLRSYLARRPTLALRGVVSSAAEVLAVAREEAVRLMFLDIGLGGMSGSSCSRPDASMPP